MSREDPQMKIRMPVELRDRVAAAADRNGRSMNAEIVQALALAFPPTFAPSARSLFADLTMVVLHWRRGEWVVVPDDDWDQFLLENFSGPLVNELIEGSNYFVVVVLGNKLQLHNIISHHYKSTEGGIESALGQSLSDDENAEYSDLMLLTKMSRQQEERLDFLRLRMCEDTDLPWEASTALVKTLQQFYDTEDILDLVSRISGPKP